ncbi:predicted protein [Postia placenta Mad-698-R]|nr:predicted protein [Postia placenta Mad-698-R]
MTRNPTLKAVLFMDITLKYYAPYFHNALARFVVSYCDPSLNAATLEAASAGIFFKFCAVPVYQKIKFWLCDAHDFGMAGETLDIVHVQPEHKDTQGHIAPAQFDTVLVNDGTGGNTGIKGGYIKILLYGDEIGTALQEVQGPDKHSVVGRSLPLCQVFLPTRQLPWQMAEQISEGSRRWQMYFPIWGGNCHSAGGWQKSASRISAHNTRQARHSSGVKLSRALL